MSVTLLVFLPLSLARKERLSLLRDFSPASHRAKKEKPSYTSSNEGTPHPSPSVLDMREAKEEADEGRLVDVGGDH